MIAIPKDGLTLAYNDGEITELMAFPVVRVPFSILHADYLSLSNLGGMRSRKSTGPALVFPLLVAF